MKEKVYIDRLFADYEDTSELRDFKEEIAANLSERIKELMSSGQSEEQAFDKATAELGDISALADDIAKKKRNEAISQMYLTGFKLDAFHSLGYTICTVLTFISILGILSWVFDWEILTFHYIFPLIVFAASMGGYTFLSLTQESAYYFPMSNRRAMLHAIGVGGLILGVCATFLQYLQSVVYPDIVVYPHLIVLPLLVLAIPFGGLLMYLALTYKNRNKPWFEAQMRAGYVKSEHDGAEMVDPINAAKFGVASGGLWILSIALFITGQFAIKFEYSWLVFLFALALQVFMVGSIFKKK